jgi:hypothetical protein
MLHIYKNNVAVDNGNSANLGVFQNRTIFPVERSPDHTPMEAQVKTTVSSGSAQCYPEMKR